MLPLIDFGNQPTGIIVAGQPTLDPRITFTRASGRTRINGAGVLESLGNNEPALDFNPVTLQPRWWLIEGARTNLALNSANFANASWVKLDTTGTANSIASPDGGVNAAILTEGVAGTADVVQSVTISAGATFTVSVFLKQGNAPFQRIEATDVASANGARVYLNYSTGVLGSVTNFGTGTGGTATVQAYPNGWYRVTVSSTVAASVVARLRLVSASSDGGGRVNNATYYAWGGQIEQAPFASSYIPTTGAAATRAEDVAIVSNYATLGWNETQGTLVIEAQLTAVGTTNAALVTISDATSANRIQIGLTPAGLLVPRIVNAGTGYNPGVPIAVTPTSVFKAAMAWGIGANQGIAAANGNLGSASTPVALPTSTTMTEGLRIGTQNIGLGVVDASLWIRRLDYYPTRLPNATIQSLTA